MDSVQGEAERQPNYPLNLFPSRPGLTEVVLESKVQRLGREVPDDVGGVSSPEGDETLIGVGPGEAVRDTLVRGGKTTLLDPAGRKRISSWNGQQVDMLEKSRRWSADVHLVLVLDQELDTLDRSGSGLGDSGRDTSHHEVDCEVRGSAYQYTVTFSRERAHHSTEEEVVRPGVE